MEKPESNKGGLLVGATDKDGGKGIKVQAPEGEIIMGGGEIIINEEAATKHCEELSKINQSTGGVAIPCDVQKHANTGKMDDGGKLNHNCDCNMENKISLKDGGKTHRKILYTWTVAIVTSIDGKHYFKTFEGEKTHEDVFKYYEEKGITPEYTKVDVIHIYESDRDLDGLIRLVKKQVQEKFNDEVNMNDFFPVSVNMGALGIQLQDFYFTTKSGKTLYYDANNAEIKEGNVKAKGGKVEENIWDRKERIKYAGRELPKPKFDVGDMVYSWQNRDYPARVSHKYFSDWDNKGPNPNDRWQFKVTLKDAEGYTHSSKWMGEDSLHATKQKEYAKGGKIDETVSAKYNIGWYGNKGAFIHADSGKVLRIFTTKETAEENWTDAVEWGEKNESLIRMSDGGRTGKLPSVEVMFENPEYNYTTSVSATTTEETARKYFVGNKFDVGQYPKEQFEKVIDIKYHPATESGVSEWEQITSGMHKGNSRAQYKGISLIKGPDSDDITVIVPNKPSLRASNIEEAKKLIDNLDSKSEGGIISKDDYEKALRDYDSYGAHLDDASTEEEKEKYRKLLKDTEAIIHRYERKDEYSNPPKVGLESIVAKYGWTADIGADGIELFNRNKKKVAIVKVKGDKYTIVDLSGTKLMSGKGKLNESVEKLLTQYYYAKPIAASGGRILKDGVYFETANLLLYGAGMDTNGNKVVKVGFPNDRAFTIQTNGTLPETHYILSKAHKEISDEELAEIEREVVPYIKEHGSKKQKAKLKIYDRMSKGGAIDKSGKKIKKGDKVKTRDGNIETVERINSNGNVETKENDYSWPPYTLELQETKVAGGPVLDEEQEVLTANIPEGHAIQSLVFDRSKFTKGGAMKWAKDNKYNAKYFNAEQTGTHHKLRQVKANKFKPSSIKTIDLADGVQAVTGQLRANSKTK